MVRPYSVDLRERAVGAMMNGMSARKVAEQFGVAASSVIKWRRLFLATHSVKPGKIGGHRPIALAAHDALIVELIETTPHLTCKRLASILGEHGIVVSHNGVWLYLRRRGYSFKKNTLRGGTTPT
jgi:transposase